MEINPELLAQAPALVRFALLIGGISALLWLIGKALERLIQSRSEDQDMPSPLATIFHRCNTPAALLVPAVLFYFLLPWDAIEAGSEVLRILIKLTIIVLATWLTARALVALEEIVTPRLGIDKADNLRARAMQTQLRVLRRIATAIVLGFGLILMLLSIDGFREFGSSLLASAGVASLIIGLAAQRTLSNLLAGFQVGFTQPIRLDDVLVVEGEWGRVEEITLTYVVVAIWDQRRLVLPISYFLEKPFQNWTRQTSEMLGTVFLRTDYCVDIESLRTELQRVAGQSEHFDGRVCLLQVTDYGERSVELRALVSAASSGAAWDLRCEVREGLLRYLQAEQPEALPRVRTRDAEAAAAAT